MRLLLSGLLHVKSLPTLLIACYERQSSWVQLQLTKKKLQLQLNNYHKITLCVRLDAQEGQRPSIKLIRANVGGHCPKQALGHCRNRELQF